MSMEILGITASIVGLLGGILSLLRSLLRGLRMEARIGRFIIVIESEEGVSQKINLETKDENSIREFLNVVGEVRDEKKLKAE